MAFMDWDEQYATGIEDIDNDHKALFMFVNDLHDKIAANAAEDSIESTLTGLVDYVNVHFVREENLLETIDYPDLDEHAEAHRRLSARVISLQEQFETDQENFDRNAFLDFLKAWLTGHIMYTDMDYVPFVRDK